MGMKCIGVAMGFSLTFWSPRSSPASAVDYDVSPQVGRKPQLNRPTSAGKQTRTN